jgi:hypothetical protein
VTCFDQSGSKSGLSSFDNNQGVIALAKNPFTSWHQNIPMFGIILSGIKQWLVQGGN